ncbi:MAG: hypothetical protein A2V21_311330 [Deltaproteobacteria bacterium GWC2_55_46]|nr:MAG: hypothetical protein A2Z79_12045 [Deltaproteobacteria bacterium GWA2_55_82]OGQ65242.1 MAG: hypothetical protein A3I81_02445 [Deltaproteobacteria bacterium RIFCSPLOWO2_02_FULL_55_12]OIJ74802.1 MAG: hypothetical protein A2V21_311330 [Deltaproteobacteria bacterium GWC2_55_46]
MGLKISEEAKKKIIDALNSARTAELTAIIQYMGHHYEGEGLESPAILDLFKKIAMEEMKHAETIAERIVYLGGVPVQKPGQILRGGDLVTMLKADLGLEDKAIEDYRAIVKLCADLGDSTTRLMFETILQDEESHADAYETALGRKGK